MLQEEDALIMNSGRYSLNSKRNQTCSVNPGDLMVRPRWSKDVTDCVKTLNQPISSLLKRHSMCDHTKSEPHFFKKSDLVDLEMIGQGAFGRVIKVQCAKTKEIMVVKEVLTHTKDDEDALVQEVKLLRNLKHPNVLPLLGVLVKDKSLCLVMEYIGGGSLASLILNLTKELSWSTRVSFARDIAAGMSYLHDHAVVHRDLNSSNCLIRNDFSLVVADFGLSIVLERRRPTEFNSCQQNAEMDELSEKYGEKSSVPFPALSNRSLLGCGCSHSVGDIKVEQFASYGNRNRAITLHDISGRDVIDELGLASVSFENLHMTGVGNQQLFESGSATQLSASFSSSSSPSPLSRKIRNGNTKNRRKKRFLLKEDVSLSCNMCQGKRKLHTVGNPFWMAPEMMRGEAYCESVDVYSFAVILCELLTRLSAESEYLPRNAHTLAIDFDSLISSTLINEDCPEDFMDIAGRCVAFNPDKRPTFSQCLSWLDMLHFELSERSWKTNALWFSGTPFS